MPFEEKNLEILPISTRKKEEIKEIFGDNEIQRFKEVNDKISSLRRNWEKLSKEDAEKLLNLEREHIALDISRHKQIKELIGPQLPTSFEYTCANSSGKIGELFDKYNKEKIASQQDWEGLSPEERERREKRAEELTALTYGSLLGEPSEYWASGEFSRILKEKEHREAEELWYLKPTEYEKYLSRFKGWEELINKPEHEQEK